MIKRVNACSILKGRLKMSLSRIEQETIINYNEAEPTATIYTHNPALRRKLEQLCTQRPGDAKRGRAFSDGGAEYIVPKRWVKVNAGPILTDEQRQKLAESAKRLKHHQVAHFDTSAAVV